MEASQLGRGGQLSRTRFWRWPTPSASPRWDRSPQLRPRSSADETLTSKGLHLYGKGVYESSLNTLVGTLFRDWLTTTQHYNVKTVNGVIPFALGQIKVGNWKYANAINQEIFRAQSSIAGVSCTDGPTRAETYAVVPTLRPDLYPFSPAHYTAKGQMDVGLSLGNAISAALDGKTKGCRSDFSPSDNLNQVMD
jgi:hypothetical protein